MRRARLLAVVSWLGGAASILPFAEEWFGLSGLESNVALFLALVSTFVLGLAIHGWPPARGAVERLAGPPARPAHALVLVATLATAGALGMLALTALLGSL